MHAFNLTPITIALFNVTLVASMLSTAGGESHGTLIPFLTSVTIVPAPVAIIGFQNSSITKWIM